MFGLDLSQLVGLCMLAFAAVLAAPAGIAKVKAFFASWSIDEEEAEVERSLVDWFSMVSDLQGQLEELGHLKVADSLSDLYPLLRHPAQEDEPR